MAPLHVANNGLSAIVDVDVFDSYFLLAFAAMPIQRLKQCRVSSRKLRCRMHGGPSPGAPKGNRNAFKHGRYTAEAIGNRRNAHCDEGSRRYGLRLNCSDVRSWWQSGLAPQNPASGCPVRRGPRYTD